MDYTLCSNIYAFICGGFTKYTHNDKINLINFLKNAQFFIKMLYNIKKGGVIWLKRLLESVVR